MSREIPSYVRSFDCVKVSAAAVTYHLLPKPEYGGWAYATINDDTLELNIQSDWGNWSYRWCMSGMATGPEGRRCTLSEFIAARGHCDYIADKLTNREEREQFDADETVKCARKQLLEMRLAQGRKLIDYYRDEDPADRVDVGSGCEGPRAGYMDIFSVRDEEWLLTKQVARDLYDEIGKLAGIDDQRDFMDSYFKVDGHSIISDDPWCGLLKYAPSPAYYQLLYGILPALVRACAKRAAAPVASVELSP